MRIAPADDGRAPCAPFEGIGDVREKSWPWGTGGEKRIAAGGLAAPLERLPGDGIRISRGDELCDPPATRAPGPDDGDTDAIAFAFDYGDLYTDVLDGDQGADLSRALARKEDAA